MQWQCHVDAVVQKFLAKMVRALFSSDEIECDYRIDILSSYHDSGKSMEVDIWIPKYNICLEYNGRQHYVPHLLFDHLQSKRFFLKAFSLLLVIPMLISFDRTWRRRWHVKTMEYLMQKFLIGGTARWILFLPIYYRHRPQRSSNLIPCFCQICPYLSEFKTNSLPTPSVKHYQKYGIGQFV